MAAPQLGYRVVRDPTLFSSNDNEDGEGGEGGCVGTIVSIHERSDEGGNAEAASATGDTAAGPSPKQGGVVVQWDGGASSSYRCGADGQYQLRLLGPIDCQQVGVSCAACGDTDFDGIGWQCRDCAEGCNVVLCSRCYSNDSHNVGHCFRAVLSPGSESVEVESRAASERLALSGIFRGAQVCRRAPEPTASEEDDEGTGRELGTVVKADVGKVLVEWPGNRRSLHAVGHQGKVELECVSPGNGGFCYPKHLPLLVDTGQPARPPCASAEGAIRVDGKEEVPEAAEETEKDGGGGGGGLTVGSAAMVMGMEDDMLQMFQQQIGAWSMDLPEMLYVIGKIIFIENSTGAIEMTYPDSDRSFHLHPAVVSPVTKFRAGEDVALLPDPGQVSDMMRKIGDFDFDYSTYRTQVGVVIDQQANSKVSVKFGLTEVLVHPGCLRKYNREQEGDTPPAHAATARPATALLPTALTGQIDFKQVLRNTMAPPQAGGAADLFGESGLDSFINILLPGVLSPSACVSIIDDTPSDCTIYDSVMRAIAAGLDVNSPCARWTLAGQDPVTAVPVILLLLCMIQEKPEQAKALVVNRPEVANTAITQQQLTALHVATEIGSVELVTMLIKHGARTDCKDASNETPLHKATRGGHADVAACILQTQPPLGVHDSKGCLPIHLACAFGQGAVLRMLLEHGIEHGFPLAEQMEALRQPGSSTPLSIAADYGSRACVQLLVECGAELNAKEQDQLNTPLHLALINHMKEEAGIPNPGLVNGFADPDSLAPLVDRIQSGLFFSSERSSRNAAIACFLAQHGADMTAQDKEGKTPLDICPNELIRDYLVQFSTDARVHDFHGSHPWYKGVGVCSSQESAEEVTEEEPTPDQADPFLSESSDEVVLAHRPPPSHNEGSGCCLPPRQGVAPGALAANSPSRSGSGKAIQLACNFAKKPIPRKLPVESVSPTGT